MVSFVKNFWIQSLVVLLAFVLRIWDIANPQRMVMDERYYVIEANSVLIRGYETYSNSDFNVFSNSADLKSDFTKITSFLNGNVDFFSWHPPLGKLFIALGMSVFGADSPFGWRIMSVLFGTGVVVLTMWLAMLIFRSKKVSIIAGLFVAVDGLAIALSRVGMLDIFLTFFSLLGFIFLTKYVNSRNMFLGKRSTVYLILMSLSFGFAAGVKWSGLYFFAGALLVVLVYEIYRKVKGASVSLNNSLKYLFKTYVLNFAFFFIAYLTVWVPYVLFYALPQNGNLFESFKDVALQHLVMLKNGQGIDAVHNFRSNAAEWFFASHPSLMFVQENLKTGEFISISSMPNLVLWIVSVISLLVFIVLLVRRRINLRGWILVTAVAFAWVPWLVFVNRTTYQYYTVVFEPYLYMILAYFVYRMLVRKKDSLGKIVGIFILACAAVFSVIAYPGAAGIPGAKTDLSHKVFNDWTNFNVEVGLYDMNQIKDVDVLK